MDSMYGTRVSGGRRANLGERESRESVSERRRSYFPAAARDVISSQLLSHRSFRSSNDDHCFLCTKRTTILQPPTSPIACNIQI